MVSMIVMIRVEVGAEVLRVALEKVALTAPSSSPDRYGTAAGCEHSPACSFHEAMMKHDLLSPQHRGFTEPS